MSTTQSGRLLLKKGRVINPDRPVMPDRPVDVLVEGGIITACGPDLGCSERATGCLIIDVTGCVIVPSVIDVLTQMGTSWGVQKETFKTGAQAAVRGGIGQVVVLNSAASPRSNPGDVVSFDLQTRDEWRVQFHAVAALTSPESPDVLSEMGSLCAAGAVGLTNALRPIPSARTMMQALRYARGFEALIAVCPVESTLCGDGTMHEGALSVSLGLSGIPRLAETVQLDRDLALLAECGGSLLVGPVTTAGAVERLRRAKSDGLSVYACTSPPYALLTEQSVMGYRTFGKLWPPLRTESDAQAICSGLLDGTIDILTSHHTPQDLESKRRPFEEAAFGASGIEHLLVLSLTLAHEQALPLEKILMRVSSGPARALGLSVGLVEEGAPADFVVIDPRRKHTLRSEQMISKSRNTPFDGRKVCGSVRLTVKGGRIAWAEQDLLDRATQQPDP